MSNKKLTCNMVNDLLPLYVDEVISEESKEAVVEHLSKCKKCQQTVADMKAKLEGEGALADVDNELFKRVRRKFRIKYFTRSLEIIIVFLVVWIGANIYVAGHYQPVNPKAQEDYIESCLEVVTMDGEFYLYQTDFFAQGDIVFLNDENGEINFYLGEKGIHNLGLVRRWNLTPKYQRLIKNPDAGKVTAVNYCKPDGTVITTLWQAEEPIRELSSK